MPKTGVYILISPTSKVYVGQSRNIEKRKTFYKQGNCKNQTRLYHSLKKHGWSKHTFLVVHELPAGVDQKILDEHEKFYIKSYRAIGSEMLNLKEGGYKGKHSAESILKMKKPRGIVTKGFSGRKHSEESKLKARNKLKGRVKTDEHRRNISIGSLGKKMSPEAIEKTRAANIGRKQSPESIAKRVLARIGKKASPEHCKKISIALKKYRSTEKGKNHTRRGAKNA